MITLSPSQQAVVDAFPEFLMDDSKELTISGFAGSGKTFLVEYLADMATKQQQMVKLIDPNIPMRIMHFSATTNKAAAVLEDMLHKEVTTIHSLLGLTVQNDYKTGKVKLTKKLQGKNLRNSIVIIDEASMVNAELLKVIREHCHPTTGCKIVWVGDSYQLPPVMEDVCPVFQESPNTHFLKEIQRQVKGSPIIQLSAMYRATLDDHELDWPRIANVGTTIMHYADKDDFFKVIENAYRPDHSPDDYKVLAWSNNRVREYNRWIRSFENYPEPFVAGEIVVTNKPLFHEKTILASTDTRHVIRRVTPAQIDGLHGFMIELGGVSEEFFQPRDWTQANSLMKQHAADAKKTRNWGPYFDIKQGWADLRPIHASTVHKAQGSTYREVFVDLANISKNTKWREVARLVYVAITRASDKVHLYGELHSNYTKKPPINLMEGFANVDCL